MTESKWVTHWTSETVYECSEIAGSAQGPPPPPQQPTMSVVKPMRACREFETWIEELCEIKRDYYIVGTAA
jgi:hypothetical protein